MAADLEAQVTIGGRSPLYSIRPYAESVTPGHPDIACNTASDYVLDEAIKASSQVGSRPRVALEVTAKAGIEAAGENLANLTPLAQEYVKEHGLVVAVGEVTLPQGIDLQFAPLIIEGFQKAGYRDPNYGFYPGQEGMIIGISKQSSQIGEGVDEGGAGDQGAMIGFAINQTKENMPLAMMIARGLTKRQFELFENGSFNNAIKPDGKSQVRLRQRLNGKKLEILGLDNVTVAVSHDPLLPIKELRKILLREQIQPVLDQYNLGIDNDTQVVINGAGEWTIYGPVADAGTENRKLMVQSYGLAAKHGGGGYSGKDPTKVDRSGALFARHIAVSLVAAGLVGACEVEVSYSIRGARAHITDINHFGTLKKGWSDRKLRALAQRNFGWTVREMIDNLNLFQPWYTDTNLKGVYGVPEFPWEQPRELI